MSSIGPTIENVPSARRVAITGEDGVSLEIDATLRQAHTGQVRPTDHPTEEGATVSDHVIDQPDELELDIIISNRPILALASVRRAPSVPGGDPATRAEDAYAAILRWMKTATLLEVSTRLRDYSGMIVLSVSPTVDKDSSEILSASIRLREFRTATVEAVDAPEPIEPIHEKKRDLGRKQKTPAATAAPEVEEKSQSLFVQIAEALQ